MKRTLFIALIGATIACIYFEIVTAIQRGREQAWLMSAVKVPGRMALNDIEADIKAGRYDSAQLKFEALRKQWAVFEIETGFKWEGLGNIMVTFEKIDNAIKPDQKAPQNAGGNP